MAQVAITGAAGSVGEQAVMALDSHDLTALDSDPIDADGVHDVEYDVTNDPGKLTSILEGRDVVIHLAAKPNRPIDAWDDALDVNIDGTKRVYEASVDAGVDRVVFASSNHAVQMYNLEKPERPGTMTLDTARTVRPGDPTRPDSFYGVSKVAGEAIGNFYADRYEIETVNFRIGWLLTEEELREKQSLSEERAKYARAMWLSPRDCRNAFRRVVDASLPESPLTLNLTSRNQGRYLSQTETLRAIGYEPRDDSVAVLE